jgi:preprotein translocase subunit SecG
MENVLLIIHLILALFLIALVLLQRSEGGGLGIGGGGGGVMSGRAAGTALSKATWGVAGAFIVTSLALTVLATQKASQQSVIDRLGVGATTEAPAGAPAGDGELADDLKGLLIPPPAVDPAAPPAAE